MDEVKEKKIRITKVAAEYSLSADYLIEFLKKKGYEVKTHNSVVTDDMLAEINAHFKKDIDKAVKHKEKITKFKEKMAQKASEEKPAKKTTKSDKAEIVEKTEKPEKEEVVQIPSKQEEVKAEPEIIPVMEKPLEVSSEPIVEIQPEPIVVEKEIQPEVVPIEIETEAPKVEDVKAVVEEQPQTETFKTETQEEIKKMKGLTVLGKIDLGKKEDEKVVEPSTAELEVEEKGKPVKKKRKKPKAKKKAETTVEETVTSKKKQKVKKFEIDDREVKETIRKTLLSMDDSAMMGRASIRRKKKKERLEEEIKRQEIKELEKNKLVVTEFIAVSELANLMEVPVSEVITKCISLGLMVSINQRLDVETITLVADEFGFEIEFAKEYTSEVLEDDVDPEETLKHRSPVVTIMGHVDHGKTSLLDYIRSTNVVAGESGGITQHIGAYKVDVGEGKYITFLDTPGHEAFTAMRARGAQVTDIVVLVVAADDAVMPQTVEAISHALAANVPIIVAINKIDKPGVNIEKIKQQLADRKVLVEDWGGKYQCVELSAKTGKNVDVLLEKILLEADVLDLKANPDRLARGVVIESELDKGRGITATVLVQKGTLKIGDPFIAGIYYGKVRAMFDERGKKVFRAEPSTPVLVLGLDGAPQAGDIFIAVANERDAHEIAIKRQQLKREQDQKQVHHLTLDDISRQISIGGVKELPIIVKGDVDGSVEALSDSLMKLSKEEVKVKVIHRGVGGISESDVLLAAASDAIIIGFHVRPNLNARKLAETQQVDIRLYNIIYDAINEVKSALEGLLSPVISESVTSTIEVRDVFKISKVGTVAGCYVQEGKIQRNNKVRLVRDGIVIYDGEILALKRFKDDVREVDSGYECGLSLSNFNDIKTGDIIEGYKIVETKKKFD